MSRVLKERAADVRAKLKEEPMGTPFDDIFEDDKKAEAIPETPETPEPETPAEAAAEPAETPEAEPSTGESEQAEDPDPEAAPPAEKDKRDDPMVPRSALEDERKKRQELERERAAERERLTALEREIQAIKGAGKGPETAAEEVTPETDAEPDMFDDPDAWRAWNRRQIMSEVKGFTEKQFIDFKVDQSVATARTRHEDFDEVMADWKGLVDKNPSLYEQATRDAQPGEFAYATVKRHRAMQEIGDDPVAWRAAEIERMRAELGQQPQTPADPQNPPQARIPPSLANARNTGARRGPGWQGPTALDDILAPDKRQ